MRGLLKGTAHKSGRGIFGTSGSVFPPFQVSTRPISIATREELLDDGATAAHASLSSPPPLVTRRIIAEGSARGAALARPTTSPALPPRPTSADVRRS